MSDAPDRTMHMLSTALGLEEKGKGFYSKAVSTCHNAVGKEIFRMLMKDEVVHMDRIRQIYKRLEGGGPWSDEWKSIQPDHKELGLLFREIAFAHGREVTTEASDMEAIDVGIDFEMRAITFYQEHLEQVTDPLEREFIEQLIKEEKSHHAALSDMKLYLSDSAAWFGEQERSGLDGA
ncbi:MAG: ferritin family protein [Deltaproteobacteria bacterium]|nr:ferritin family protein [Deltaproteobacteria bacterium]MBW2172506.1 ferritin family protein [Deltaproteobacteria bacterium]